MNYLGIEIGGTKLQIGVGPADGKLKGLWRGNVDVAAGADGIRQQIAKAVPELLKSHDLPLSTLQGIGIGFGGPVDDANQTVIKSHQIQGWDNFPLADWISDILKLPAALGNDADCAGLAEALYGAGKGLSPIFYITIGSGIGGGLIINGEIYRGCGRGAAEIGHLRIPDFGWELYSTLENHSSGWAIAYRTLFRLERETEATSYLRDQFVRAPKEITAQLVAHAAEIQRDELANSVLNDAWGALAEGICQVICLLCPRRVVIGGGVSLMGEKVLFEPLRRLVADRVFKPFADCYDIVPAALGEEVVLHGAMALAKMKSGGHTA